MNPRPSPATVRRAAAAQPERSGRASTTTVVYDCAHLRVRASGADVLWCVRDVVATLGFRLPLTPASAAPRVLRTTEELPALTAAAGLRPPADFTAWAAQLPYRLPCPGAAPGR
ncbi:hypothetical protein ACIP5N_21730 [Streptomyces sp. NPDC088768]|uniref:hypothetical protein n=1 Tax=Streptomyces sp. NPDC088768 TaxID=3365894 RepID=UPI0037FAED3B